ncbi:MAG TPA: RnfABCDGE type electron transport complex subunit B [Clostridiales bacterium]|nr:RnfABCDGE type electron transport complex subunit B [Clostridiales bacterium]
MVFMEIIVAVVIVGIIGFIAGLGLSVASVVMAVPSNEHTEKLRAVLPGVNCGACGYSGCDAYANALAEGSAKTNLCIPGGKSTVTRIAELLGVQADDFMGKKAKVLCNGSYVHTERKIKYKGIPTCDAANMMYSGTSACDYACLGFGDCANACEYGAIEIKNGVAVVDPRKCTGCTKCVSACPKQIIEMLPESANVVVICKSLDKGAVVRRICDVGCIGCKLCVKVCQYDAITVDDNLAVIDQGKCTSCGECVKVCPQNCIKMTA